MTGRQSKPPRYGQDDVQGLADMLDILDMTLADIRESYAYEIRDYLREYLDERELRTLDALVRFFGDDA